MKKLILILAIFATTMVLKAEGNPRDDYLKKHLKLSDLRDKSQTECDLCGCYMGLEPNFSQNQIGIRYQTLKFHADAKPVVSNPLVDHQESGETESNEYYNNIEIYGRIYLSPKARILFGIPFKFNEFNTKKINGVGDMRVLGQYSVFTTPITGMTKFWQRIFLGGGLKLPTGVYNKQLTYGVTEPHFQPGTGSLDIIMTGLYMAKLEKVGLGWRNDIAYTVTTKNKNEYQFANRFNLASTLTYDINSSSMDYVPHAGVYYETANADKQNGVNAPGSGGYAFFATGGVDFYYKVLSLDFLYEWPLSQNLFDNQPENQYRFYVSAGYAF